MSCRCLWVVLCAALLVSCVGGRGAPEARSAPPPAGGDSVSRHERLTPEPLDGVRRTFAGPGGRDVEVLVPRLPGQDSFSLVVHFHGAAWLPQQAVAHLSAGTVAAVVNLGAGSAAYGRPFADAAAFDSLLAGVAAEVAAVAGGSPAPAALTLTAFSAGYGAVRAILREPRHFARTGAVVLLDGMHASYVPEGVPLAEGGRLDSTHFDVFVRFAESAVRGEKRFLVTHSEIVPGSYASNRETADWLLGSIGVRRTAVGRRGSRGMWQTSEAGAGGFELLGFAGETAADHIDHLHALPELLARVLKQPVRY